VKAKTTRPRRRRPVAPSLVGIVDTMRQAVARTGLAAAKVDLAKALGCPAFLKGSRVDCDALVKWVDEHPEIETAPEAEEEAVDIRLKTARAAKAEKDTERAEFELDVVRQKFYPRDQVRSTLHQIAQQQRAVLQRVLESELPPKLAGLTVIEIGERMRVVVDQICLIFHDRTSQWIEDEKPKSAA